MRLGVPYADAWGMPIPLALEFVTVATERAKSNAQSKNQSNNSSNTPTTQSTMIESTSTKQVATRRKSKLVKDKGQL
ncbi:MULTISPECIES: hypothetical protein [unclassified Moraxella]|uniref:hypothetical protein n=1 Tax=unclassified Moraxella TaxID=2685852 RepID=UPI003AF982F8